MRNRAAWLGAAALAAALSLDCNPVCDCPPDVAGLLIETSEPVTDVELQGPACSGGRFRCVPQDFDSAIHGPCTRIQIEARAEGRCLVNLTMGGAKATVDREMTRRPAGCCGGFIGESNHQGEIDLRQNDGGSD